ncbi:MAG TPA: biotin--[acetyl-CoA-carboxylase] ligase [Myxococcaceae bacterium]|nr:biotin--[acetyl-CoA-carboxylase] ligase [Myxococcaceae bacterium]
MGHTDRQDATHAQLVLEMLVDSGTDYASGEALSGKLGLSRTAVWKVVNVLRDRGYAIEAVPSRGYRLIRVPDRLTALEILPLLETGDLGRTVHAFDSLPSTSELAFRLAAEGAEHGELILAETQTAGRGRRGRSWASPPGKNLYASLVLRPELPPQRAPELTLLAAVAVAEALRGEGVEASIKWPNDLQVGGKKIAGILTELSAESDQVHFVVLGIGVNLNAEPSDFPPDVSRLATSVLRVLGRRVDRAAFVARLLKLLEQWLAIHETDGFGPVRARWRALSSTLGLEVLVKSERRELRGVAEDIDTDGALLLRTEDGMERVLAGEVEQVRPRVRPSP